MLMQFIVSKLYFLHFLVSMIPFSVCSVSFYVFDDRNCQVAGCSLTSHNPTLVSMLALLFLSIMYMIPGSADDFDRSTQ